MNAVGKLNAAPFSAYNYMGTDPPIVAIGVGNRPGPMIGKDTAQNMTDIVLEIKALIGEDW